MGGSGGANGALPSFAAELRMHELNIGRSIWPIHSRDEISKLLSEISRGINMIKPGDWCKDDCLQALKRLRETLWDVQALLGLQEIKRLNDPK